MASVIQADCGTFSNVMWLVYSIFMFNRRTYTKHYKHLLSRPIVSIKRPILCYGFNSKIIWDLNFMKLCVVTELNYCGAAFSRFYNAKRTDIV